MKDRPWWWLDDAERARLGLGSAVKRSEKGVLFGDSRRPFRLEIIARTDDAKDGLVDRWKRCVPEPDALVVTDDLPVD